MCTSQLKEPGCVAAGGRSTTRSPRSPLRRRHELDLSVLRHPIEQAAARIGSALSSSSGQLPPPPGSAAPRTAFMFRAHRVQAARSAGSTCRVFSRLFRPLPRVVTVCEALENVHRKTRKSRSRWKGVCVLPYSIVCLPPPGSAAATIGPLPVRLRVNTRNEQNRKRQPALIGEFLVGHLRSPSSGMSPHCATGAVGYLSWLS